TCKTASERFPCAKIQVSSRYSTLIDQDIATIALLLFVVIYLLLFPGGPGTPRRFGNPWEPARAKLEG
ncbi:MAG TPA: hypothetical protein VGL72_14970, partial [Bryobacteraceae bacterium]